MKITVQRSGGIAALTREWSVKAETEEDKSRWGPLIEACPWDAVPGPEGGGSSNQPDRFMYSIRAGQHRATLPERAVTGPWRVLVDNTRAAAEASREVNGQR